MINSDLLNGVATLLAGPLILLGAPLFFLTVVFLSLVRDLVSLSTKLWKQRELGEMVSSFGPIMATDGPFVNDALTQYAVLELDTAEPDLDLLRGEFQRLVVDAKDPGTREPLYPELKCTVEPWLGYLFWKPLKACKLSRYFVEYKDTGLPQPQWEDEEEALNDLLTHVGRRAWRRGHPLWEVIVVPNVPMRFFSTPPFEGTGSLLIFRGHRVLLDGYAMAAILARVLGVGFPDQPKRIPKRHTLVMAGLWALNFLKVSLYLAKMALLGFVYGGAVLPNARQRQEDGNDRVVTVVTEAFPLQHIREIKKAYSVQGFTAVVLAGVAGAVRRMYKEDQQMPPELIPGAVTPPLYDHPLTLVNHGTPGILFIPTGGRNPKERLDYFNHPHVKVDVVMARILFHIAVQVEKFPFALAKVGRRVLEKYVPAGSTSLGRVGLSNVMFPVGVHKLANAYPIIGAYAGMNSPPNMGKSVGLYLTSFNMETMRLVVTSRGTAFRDRDQARKFAQYCAQEWEAMYKGASKASSTTSYAPSSNVAFKEGEANPVFVA